MRTGKIKRQVPLPKIRGGSLGTSVSANSQTTETISIGKTYASSDDYQILLTMGVYAGEDGDDYNFGSIWMTFHSKTVSGFTVRISNASSVAKNICINWVVVEV